MEKFPTYKELIEIGKNLNENGDGKVRKEWFSNLLNSLEKSNNDATECSEKIICCILAKVLNDIIE